MSAFTPQCVCYVHNIVFHPLEQHCSVDLVKNFRITMQRYMVLVLSSILTYILIFIPTVKSDDVILQKRMFEQGYNIPLDPKRKKPFCNAFTGCGKKRADESMGTLVEMNSEPAVEELSRQILSEAKLWEAIQEARLELMRRKQKHEEKQRQMQMQMEANVLSGNGKPLTFAGFRKKRSPSSNDPNC
uniref:Cardioactive peptide n=2 Tax=Cacopsylla melanoneura TaxID=428564 RepID=A0A8D8YKB0_9HEMI